MIDAHKTATENNPANKINTLFKKIKAVFCSKKIPMWTLKICDIFFKDRILLNIGHTALNWL